jgi:hypothetical protein
MSEASELPPEPEQESDGTFDAAVRNYMAENGVVVKWVLIADVLDGEGNRGFYVDNSEGTPNWDMRGMAEHLSTILQRAVYTYTPDEDDD